MANGFNAPGAIVRPEDEASSSNPADDFSDLGAVAVAGSIAPSPDKQDDFSDLGAVPATSEKPKEDDFSDLGAAAAPEAKAQTDDFSDLGATPVPAVNEPAAKAEPVAKAQTEVHPPKTPRQKLEASLDFKQDLLNKLDYIRKESKGKKDSDVILADGTTLADAYAGLNTTAFDSAGDDVKKAASEIVNNAYTAKQKDRSLFGGVLRDALKRGVNQAATGIAQAGIGYKPGELTDENKAMIVDLNKASTEYATVNAPKRVSGLQDVDGISDLAAFAIESIAENAPRAAVSVSGSVIGGIVAGPVGAAAGAGVGGFTLNYAEALDDQAKEGRIHRGYAAGQGAAYSAIDVLMSPEKLLGGTLSQLLKKTVMQQSKDEFIDTGMKVLRKTLASGALGGAGEALQSQVGGRGIRYLQTGTGRQKNPDGSYESNSDIMWAGINEVAGGFFADATMSGASNAAEYRKNNAAVDTARKNTVLQTFVAATGKNINQFDGHDALAIMSVINSDVNLERLNAAGQSEMDPETRAKFEEGQNAIKNKALEVMSPEARTSLEAVNGILASDFSMAEVDKEQPTSFSAKTVADNLENTEGGGKFGYDPLSGIGIAQKDGQYSVLNLNGLRMPKDVTPSFDNLSDALAFAEDLSRFNDQRMVALAPKFKLMTEIAQAVSPGASVKIVDTPYGLPKDVRERYIRAMSDNSGDAPAMYDAKTDMIYLVNNGIRSIGEAVVTIHHEALHSELENMSQMGELPNGFKTGTSIEEQLVSAWEGRFDEPTKWENASAWINEGVSVMAEKMGIKSVWNPKDSAETFMRSVNRRMRTGDNDGVRLETPSPFNMDESLVPPKAKATEAAPETTETPAPEVTQEDPEAVAREEAKYVKPAEPLVYTPGEIQVVSELKKAGFTTAAINAEIEKQRKEAVAVEAVSAPDVPVSEQKPVKKSFAELTDIKPEPVNEIDASRKEADRKTPFRIMDEIQKAHEIVNLPVDIIIVNSKGREQWKEGADPVSGVVPGKAIRSPINKVSVKPIVVVQSLNGDYVISTGRHRLDGYKWNKEPTIPSVILKESDGWDAEASRALDAIDNIQDEQGSPHDYQKFFESARLTEAEVRTLGLIDRKKGADAWGLYKNGSADLRNAIDWENNRDGGITYEQAAAIASASPLSDGVHAESVQRVAMRAVMDGKDRSLQKPKILEYYVRAMAQSAKNVVSKEEYVDGGLGGILEDMSWQRVAAIQGKYVAAKVADFSNLRTILSNALNRQESLQLTKVKAKELGISDPKNTKQLFKALEKVKMDLARWTKTTWDEDQSAEINAAIAPELEREGITVQAPVPRESVSLESVTPEQIQAEKATAAQKARLADGVNASIEGSASNIDTQADMFAGDTTVDGGQDALFQAALEKPAEEKSVKETPAPKQEADTTPALKSGAAAIVKPNADGVAYTGRIEAVNKDGTVVFRATGERANGMSKKYQSHPLTGKGGYVDMTVPAKDVMVTENVTQRKPTKEEAARMREQTIADAVAYENELKVGETEELRFRRVTPAQDAEYLDAVARGDTATAQKMVDDAAKAAGYNIGPVYHGTNAEFNEFKYTEDIGFHLGTKQQATRLAMKKGGVAGNLEGFNVGVSQEELDSTLPRVVRAHIRLENPVKANDTIWYHYRAAAKALVNAGAVSQQETDSILQAVKRSGRGEAYMLDRLQKLLLKKGFDGVEYANDFEGRGISYIVFAPSQIKSADPITRDDAGNIIPLSERFNEDTADIRFRRARNDYVRANPAKNLKARDAVFTIEDAYADALDARTVKETQAKGIASWNRDRVGTELDFLSGRKLTGKALDDAELMARDKVIVDDMTSRAAENPSDETKAATAMLGTWRWYERGTEAARALQIRFDPWTTPEGRRALILRLLYQPTSGDIRRLKNAKNIQAQIEILKPRAKQAAVILKALREKGIDIPKLTSDMLMDQKFINKIMQEISTRRASLGDKIHEYWRNAILSGPKTQIANIVGNTAHAILDLGIARPVEAILNSVVGKTDTATFKSVSAMYKAILPSIKDANKNFAYVWKNETSNLGDNTSKMEESNAAISDKWGGYWIRTPQRLMGATDDWFKTVFMAMLTADYAVREFDALVADGKLEEGDREMYLLEGVGQDSGSYAKALDETLRLSFQHEPGQFAAAIMSLRNHPQAGFMMKFVFPFVKTPANIIATGVRKSPLHLPLYLYRLATKKYAPHDVMRLGVEQAIGMVILGILYGLAKDDDEDKLNRPRITGSRKSWRFSTQGEREFAQRNEPPMSVRVGDKWVSYSRIEPFATMVATMVDGLNSWEYAKKGQLDDFGQQVISSMTSLVRDKNFTQGIDNLMSVLDGDVGMFADIAAGFSPNIIRATLQAFDPYVRDYGNREKGSEWLKKEGEKTLQKSLPAASLVPLPKRDITGQQIKKTTGPLYNMLTPAPSQPADKKSRVDVMVDRYNKSSEKQDRWWPSIPRLVEYSFGRDKVRMNESEYDEYQELAGELSEKILSGLNFNFDSPTEKDIDRVKKVYEKAREKAKADLRGKVVERWRKESAQSK